MQIPNAESREYVEALYAAYRRDPASVDAQWRELFDAMGDTSRPGPSWTAPKPPAPVEVAIARIPVFSALRDDERAALRSASELVTLREGEVLFRQGDAGRSVFAVVDGHLTVDRDGQLLTEMAPGSVFGEVSVIDQQPRSATVVASVETSLVRIDGKRFIALLQSRPTFALRMMRAMSQRLRRASSTQEKVDQLVRAYRERGHVLASLDPLGPPSGHHPELTIEHYGLGEEDLDEMFSSRSLGGGTRSLREMLGLLRRTYCGSIGVQYMHIDDLAVQRWLQERMEHRESSDRLALETQRAILKRLTDAEVFEQFLHRKFLGAKRFSLEGGESLIPLMALAIEEAGNHGCEEIVIGMAHRGRLNVMANILGKSPALIFREFADQDPELHLGKGDVKYHLGHSSDWRTAAGRSVHLTLCFNPSHLECVGPVVNGRVRAKQHRRGDEDRLSVLPFIIHGDSAIAGEGVVQEMLNMSELEGYRVGGSVHLVLNNQIGFTTTPDRARSTRYATDLARMLQVPIWHVNGEDPEAVARVITLAMQFRSQFRRDVVIDMYCYRKHGHNEGDEPAFTQPLLYDAIRRRRSVRESYVQNLVKLGGITVAEADEIAAQSQARLDAELDRARDESFVYEVGSMGGGHWKGIVGGADAEVDEPPTALPHEQLATILAGQADLPEKFTPHPKIRRLLDQRRQMAEGERPLDWGAGELLAMATLLHEGTHIRLSGQDAGRGTFSHRHAVLRDIKTGRTHLPLQTLSGQFEVWDSPLTETAVLGFDYGYSLDYPDALVIWEAQFGDFANVAQVIIDQFISSAEDKWRRLSGLVMLLPHGFEGQGPEHSSARLERYLTLAAEDNMQIVNLTTPAQLFHCLRRQVHRPYRKPLVVMSPKSLLRHPKAVSALSDFSDGEFQRVIPDVTPPGTARKVVLVSGKLYYELEAHREAEGITDVAVVRVEQYYPLARGPLEAALAPFGDVPVIWAQEEPENMGAWPFLERHLPRVLERPVTGVTRPASASPATGSAAAHRIEQARLIEAIFS